MSIANGMYNWTNDVPQNSKIVFQNILELFRGYENPRILEIGTYTGTSILEMLNYLPKATGVVVDNWKLSDFEKMVCRRECEKNGEIYKEDIRDIFKQNVNIHNLQSRLILCEGDSCLVLRRFVNKQERFDFIYVDGSHFCLDLTVDLVLSWMLLNVGGVLGIDDYGYEKDEWHTPKKSVDHFLEKYEGDYKILHKSYRIFLVKIRD